jgi:hypothetical protein
MNNKLFELEVRKIIQEYKLLEIEEEWKNELIDSNKDIFLKEIYQHKGSENNEEKSDVSLDVEDGKSYVRNNQISDNVKKIFREIVKITHPDKNIGKNNRNELNDIYIKAKIAYEDSNIYDLLVICDKLSIRWVIDISEKKMLEDNLEIKRNKIKSIESSYIWLWIKAESVEEKYKIVNLFIEKNS